MPPIPPTSPLPRLILYHQTHHTPSGDPISLLPLLTQRRNAGSPGAIAITHIILAAIHLNEDPSAMTLNDDPPAHPRFDPLWSEVREAQRRGVKVLGMLGGAAKGSYARLDCAGGEDDFREDSPAELRRFESYYAPLRDMVRTHALDGLDLDVEEPMTLRGVVRLIDRLRADFGGPDRFIVTLAPVAAALLGTGDPRHNLSGFDYEALEVMRGADVAWYNAQFYCGWGDCGSPAMYEAVIARGWPRDKVVVGLVTNPANGAGWVAWDLLGHVLVGMRARGRLGALPGRGGQDAREGFAGVMGWEYFNALPGGHESPWKWAEWMTRVLRGDGGVWGATMLGPGAEVSLPEPEWVLAEAREKVAKTEKAGETEVDPDAAKAKDAPLPEVFEYYTDAEDDA